MVQEQEQASAARHAVFEVGRAEPVFELLMMSSRQLDGKRGFAAAHDKRLRQRVQNLDGKGTGELS